jgi:hypothetical protein
MEIGWEESRYAAFLRRPACGRRLSIFDRRGMGMSDPTPPTVTLDERADDIWAVMDADSPLQRRRYSSTASPLQAARSRAATDGAEIVGRGRGSDDGQSGRHHGVPSKLYGPLSTTTSCSNSNPSRSGPIQMSAARAR